MSNRTKSLLIGLAAAVIVFFSYGLIFSKKNKKVYTVHYVTEIVPGTYQPGLSQEDVMSRMPVTISHRIDDLGYRASIKRNGDRIFDITISNVEDTALLRQVITSNSKLELREVYSLAEIHSSFTAINVKVKNVLSPRKAGDTLAGVELPKLHLEEPVGLFALISFSIDPAHPMEAYRPEIGTVMKRDTALLNKILRHEDIRIAFPYDLKFHYGPSSAPDYLYLYAIRTNMQEAELQNKDIKGAEATHSSGNLHEITFQFNNIAARKWEKMTTRNVGKNIAMVVDDLVISAPRVNEPITGGTSIISGYFTAKEAELLAYQLRTGMLPAQLTIEKEELTRNHAAGAMRASISITLISFIVATVASFFIFNMLKNS